MTILRYGVMGNPVRHSKSPHIHQRFATQFDLKIEYGAILVEKDGFKKAVQDFFKTGGSGLNITLPFKNEAFTLSSEHGEAAILAQAVNTLTRLQKDKLRGDNTDGVGLLRDLQHNLKFSLQNKKVLVVGAGGAAQGILGPLLKNGAQIVLINRTVATAVALAQRFKDVGTIRAAAITDISDRRFDLVINATSMSLAAATPLLPDRIFANPSLAYDLAYSDEPSPFMRWAGEQGATQATDGLGMLVEQAAESFFIWHDKRAKTENVLRELRAHAA